MRNRGTQKANNLVSVTAGDGHRVLGSHLFDEKLGHLTAVLPSAVSI